MPKSAITTASRTWTPNGADAGHHPGSGFSAASAGMTATLARTKVSLTTAFVVLISTARLPLIEMLALLPLIVVL